MDNCSNFAFSYCNQILNSYCDLHCSKPTTHTDMTIIFTRFVNDCWKQCFHTNRRTPTTNVPRYIFKLSKGISCNFFSPTKAAAFFISKVSLTGITNTKCSCFVFSRTSVLNTVLTFACMSSATS